MKNLKKRFTFSTFFIGLVIFIFCQSAQALTVSEQRDINVKGDVESTISLFINTKTNVNSVVFGGGLHISPTVINTASPDITLTVLTNNLHGYKILIKDRGDGNNPGLYNSKDKFIIGSADYNYSDIIDLSKEPGFGVQAISSQAEIASRYNQSGDKVGGYEILPVILASYPEPADYHVITLIHKARASGDTPVGAYVDVLTVITIPNF